MSEIITFQQRGENYIPNAIRNLFTNEELYVFLSDIPYRTDPEIIDKIRSLVRADVPPEKVNYNTCRKHPDDLFLAEQASDECPSNLYVGWTGKTAALIRIQPIPVYSRWTVQIDAAAERLVIFDEPDETGYLKPISYS